MLRMLRARRTVAVDPDVAIRLAAGLRSEGVSPELIAFRIALGILEEETGAEDFAHWMAES